MIRIHIGFTNPEDQQFVDDLRTHEMTLPNMKKISLNNILQEDDDARDFFDYCFPNKLELFTLDRDFINNFKINYILPDLFKALKKVSREIFIRGYQMDAPNFASLIKASSQCEKVKLFD